jgi:aminopeptidase N
VGRLGSVPRKVPTPPAAFPTPGLSIGGDSEAIASWRARPSARRLRRQIAAFAGATEFAHPTRRTYRLACENCGKRNEVVATERDPEQDRKNLDTLSAVKVRLATAERQGVKDNSDAVRKLLRDRSEMTDEELAREIALRSAELGQPADVRMPDEQRLSI